MHMLRQINYLNWSLLTANHDVFRFVQGMIGFRKSHPSIARSQYWREDVSWYGSHDKGPDFSPESQTLAYCLRGDKLKDDDIYVMVNAGASEVLFQIQEGKGSDWLLVADTSLASPQDFVEPQDRRHLTTSQYRVPGRSVVVLLKPILRSTRGPRLSSPKAARKE